MLPHYSFVVIFTEAQHYPADPKLSNHIHTFTILWTMLKISVQILLLPVLHLQNSFKCLKPKSHFKTMFSPPASQESTSPRKAKPNKWRTTQVQPTWVLLVFLSLFLCSVTKLNIANNPGQRQSTLHVYHMVLHIIPGMSLTDIWRIIFCKSSSLSSL